MIGISPLQFKHVDSNDKWYRRGEQNLEYRFGQVLNLQPDFVEFQTWNDAGESHYMGNSWPEPTTGTNIGTYTTTYDHTGYQQVIPAFIRAWKAGDTTTSTMYPSNGAIAQSVFWHHTLLTNGSCTADSLGNPIGVETVENKVTVNIPIFLLPSISLFIRKLAYINQAIVLVAAGHTTLSISISSGGAVLGTIIKPWFQ